MTARPFRVLLVEDDPANVTLFSAILEREGYAVEAVTNGNQAEQHVEAFRPDLILMDINLPGTDGAELLRRLRCNASTARLRILAVTAHAMKGDDEKFLAMGFDGYIAKPIVLKSFRETIRQNLEG